MASGSSEDYSAEDYRVHYDELLSMYDDYYDSSDKSKEKEELEALYGWGVISVFLKDEVFVAKLRTTGKWKVQISPGHTDGRYQAFYSLNTPKITFPPELKGKMVEVDLGPRPDSETPSTKDGLERETSVSLERPIRVSVPRSRSVSPEPRTGPLERQYAC
jgi:hypothetical protein